MAAIRHLAETYYWSRSSRPNSPALTLPAGDAFHAYPILGYLYLSALSPGQPHTFLLTCATNKRGADEISIHTPNDPFLSPSAHFCVFDTCINLF